MRVTVRHGFINEFTEAGEDDDRESNASLSRSASDGKLWSARGSSGSASLLFWMPVRGGAASSRSSEAEPGSSCTNSRSQGDAPNSADSANTPADSSQPPVAEEPPAWVADAELSSATHDAVPEAPSMDVAVPESSKGLLSDWEVLEKQQIDPLAAPVAEGSAVSRQDPGVQSRGLDCRAFPPGINLPFTLPVEMRPPLQSSVLPSDYAAPLAAGPHDSLTRNCNNAEMHVPCAKLPPPPGNFLPRYGVQENLQAGLQQAVLTPTAPPGTFLRPSPPPLQTSVPLQQPWPPMQDPPKHPLVHQPDPRQGNETETELDDEALKFMVPRNDQGWLSSLGSRCHPDDCSPCIFWFRGLCSKGWRCEFCHFRHVGQRNKRIRPSKNTRMVMRAAASSDALPDALPTGLITR